MASGVPVVSTRVGMAPDLIDDGVSGALVDIEDVPALVARARELLALPEGGVVLKRAARQSVHAGRGPAVPAVEPADRAGAHYLLAKLLHATNDDSAKRHALLALEETPRFRDAQRLLLAIVNLVADKPEKKP